MSIMTLKKGGPLVMPAGSTVATSAVDADRFPVTVVDPGNPMMTDAESATLAARLGEPDCVGLEDGAAAAVLSAQGTIPNPAPAPQVPAPFRAMDFLKVLPVAKVPPIKQDPMFGRIMDDIDTQDREMCIDGITYLKMFGLLDDSDIAKLTGIVEGTMPDPSWPAVVHTASWAAETFPDRPFVHANGSIHINQISPEMVAETRARKV